MKPKHGELVGHCGHLTEHYHMIKLNQFYKFELAIGGVVESQWVVLCDQCFQEQIGGDLFVHGVGRWGIDQPLVAYPESVKPPTVN